jgi:hypothetical protein
VSFSYSEILLALQLRQAEIPRDAGLRHKENPWQRESQFVPGSSAFAQFLQSRDSGIFNCQIRFSAPMPKQRPQVGFPHFLQRPPLDESNSRPQQLHFQGINCSINPTMRQFTAEDAEHAEIFCEF